ncbi:MAG: TolC family protein [Mangrovibacterium sp.]
MRTILFKNTILVTGIAAMLLSCNSTRHFHKETVDTENLYGDTVADDSTTMADTPWQELFADPYLQDLISEGLDNNPDLQIAVYQVMEAEAYFSQSKASFYPTLDVGATAAYVRNSKDLYPAGPRDYEDYQLAAQSSWEVDIWGKLRSSKRAAYGDLLASDAGKKVVQTRLVANIASAYYTLMALDDQLAVTRQTVKNYIDLVETMKALKENGQVTGAAVVQTEANLHAAEVSIPDLEQQIRETQNTLCILLGRTPGNIERGALEDQKKVALLQTGVPSQLLDNRPDVMQAEYQVMSAFEITRNARSYFYPALTITASTGFESGKLHELLDPDQFIANVLGGLSAPLFNKRANATRLKVSRAQQEEALINLRNVLLTAGQEVNNAMGSYESAEKKTVFRQQQLNALQLSVEYTEELLTYGSADYTEVLTARQSLLAAQLNDVDDRLQQFNAVVSLYRALGGGWK